jgi:hypothetical protein
MKLSFLPVPASVVTAAPQSPPPPQDQPLRPSTPTQGTPRSSQDSVGRFSSSSDTSSPSPIPDDSSTLPSDVFVKGHLGATPTYVTGIVRLEITPADIEKLRSSPELIVRFRGITQAGFRISKSAYFSILRTHSNRIGSQNSEQRRLFDEQTSFWDFASPNLNDGETLAAANNDSSAFALPGVHEFPFRFNLPKILPPSFISKHGSVLYYLSGESWYLVSLLLNLYRLSCRCELTI